MYKRYMICNIKSLAIETGLQACLYNYLYNYIGTPAGIGMPAGIGTPAGIGIHT